MEVGREHSRLVQEHLSESVRVVGLRHKPEFGRYFEFAVGHDLFLQLDRSVSIFDIWYKLNFFMKLDTSAEVIEGPGKLVGIEVKTIVFNELRLGEHIISLVSQLLLEASFGVG